jgi:hypothetical protein
MSTQGSVQTWQRRKTVWYLILEWLLRKYCPINVVGLLIIVHDEMTEKQLFSEDITANGLGYLHFGSIKPVFKKEEDLFDKGNTVCRQVLVWSDPCCPFSLTPWV